MNKIIFDLYEDGTERFRKCENLNLLGFVVSTLVLLVIKIHKDYLILVLKDYSDSITEQDMAVDLTMALLLTTFFVMITMLLRKYQMSAYISLRPSLCAFFVLELSMQVMFVINDVATLEFDPLPFQYYLFIALVVGIYPL